MRIKERYALLNYAKKQYCEQTGENFEFMYLSKKRLFNFLKTNRHSSMNKMSYCCYGLYHCCWYDAMEEGLWDATQKDVERVLRRVIARTAKKCRRDNRILFSQGDDYIKVIIVYRDVDKNDYMLVFTDVKEE